MKIGEVWKSKPYYFNGRDKFKVKIISIFWNKEEMIGCEPYPYVETCKSNYCRNLFIRWFERDYESW